MSLPVLPPKPPPLQLLLMRVRQALIALTPNRLKAVKLTHWLWIAVATMLVLFFAWMLWPRSQMVETARVDRGEVRRDIVDEGRTRIHDVFTIAAPVSGALQRIGLEPGDSVTHGQVVEFITAGRIGGQATVDAVNGDASVTETNGAVE